MLKLKKNKKNKKKKGGALRFNSGSFTDAVVSAAKAVGKRLSGPPDAFIGAVDSLGGTFSPAMVRQGLLLFYAKHDPDKEDLEDILDILVHYASTRGIIALNVKLQMKYGENLDHIDLEDDFYDDSDYDDEEEPPPPDERSERMADEPPPPDTDEEYDSDLPPPAIPSDIMDQLEGALPPPPPPDDVNDANRPKSKHKSKTKSVKDRKQRGKSFFARRRSSKKPDQE